MYYKKEKPEVVFKAAIIKKEKAETRLRWIFISDVYVVEKNGNYVNYFNEDEIYYTDGDDIQLKSMKKNWYNEIGVMKDMLFNPNYCKDRLKVMDAAIKRGLILNEQEQKRYIDVLDFDGQIDVRYNKKIKQKR